MPVAAALGSSSMVVVSICSHTTNGRTQKGQLRTPAVLVEEPVFSITSFRASFPKVVTMMVEPVEFIYLNAIHGEVA